MVVYDTGGLRRAHLRGHQNILKRLLVHAGAFNLGLGTPRGLQGRRVALAALEITIETFIDRVWTAMTRLWSIWGPMPHVWRAYSTVARAW
jgi:transposase